MTAQIVEGLCKFKPNGLSGPETDWLKTEETVFLRKLRPFRPLIHKSRQSKHTDSIQIFGKNCRSWSAKTASIVSSQPRIAFFPPKMKSKLSWSRDRLFARQTASIFSTAWTFKTEPI
ncbi:unnamed protein product [Caenorhabditis sp. 36 PRJEB53466]|nr:unnamed protein product [Caenorhabditis sp. 36 PRJEB53466]